MSLYHPHALKYSRFWKAGRDLLRNENISFPKLQRKVILGTITSKDDKGYYTVETGFKTPVKFNVKELIKGRSTKFTTDPIPQVGEKMPLYVRYIENPMGELEVSSSERLKIEREEGVWRELREIHREGGMVKGRVLNAVNGGYAVGVAGHICFLPQREIRPYKGQSVPPLGDLLQFRILQITETTKNVVLTGPHSSSADSKRPKAWAGRGNFGGGGGGGGASGRAAFWKKQAANLSQAQQAKAKAVGGEGEGATPFKEPEMPRPGTREDAESGDGREKADDGRPVWKG